MNMLTKQQILLLHSQLIRQSGGSDGIRDEGMLDSAISQPFQTFDDMELYPSIVDKAVRLEYGLITNHPFVDGNKRIGTHIHIIIGDNRLVLIRIDQLHPKSTPVILKIARKINRNVDFSGFSKSFFD